MPKNNGDQNSPKKKKKSKKVESDSDSSSDYDPKTDEMEDMSTIDMQRFMQKLFPSKSGKERLKQLEKLDKLMYKSKTTPKSKKKNKKIPDAPKKKKKKRTKKDKEEEIEEEDDGNETMVEVEEEDEEDITDDDEYVIDDDDDDEEYDDYLDEEEMQEFMKNNMKFNIIFSVPQGGMQGYDDYDEDEEDEEDQEDEEDEEEEEEEAEEEKKEDKEEKKSPKRKKKKSLKDKPIDDVTEDEWMELMQKQEKEMRENGTYYSTKYKKDDKIFLKMKGWDDFKLGKIQRVQKRSRRMRAKYDIILDKKYKGKKIYKNILSKNIKSYKTYKSENKEEEEDALLNELKQLLDAKKEGDDILQKKFNELAKAKANKDEKLKKKKEAKLKQKNFITLRKLLREKNVMNDFKYFKKLELSVQEKIIYNITPINNCKIRIKIMISFFIIRSNKHISNKMMLPCIFCYKSNFFCGFFICPSISITNINLRNIIIIMI